MNNYWLLDRPIAHRGLHCKENGIPENSIPAFQNAIDHNFNIELDVHVTKDGEVVVFHDQTAKRMCGVDKVIRKMTYKEVSELKLDGLDIHPPKLQEVLDLVDGKVGIVIELKSVYLSLTFKLERYLYNVLKCYNGNYCIKSFNPLTELWFFNHHHKVCRGVLVGLNQKTDKYFYAPIFPFCDFISFNVNHLPSDITEKKFHKKNKPVICWTVNSVEDIEKVKQFGDNIVFERLDTKIVEEYYNFNKNIPKRYDNFLV